MPTLPAGVRLKLLPLAAVLLAALPAQTFGQSSDSALTADDRVALDAAASRIADRISDANLTESNPSVLVIDFFRGSPGTSAALGTLLADHFSETLGNLSFSKNFRVLDRKAFSDYLTKEWATLEDLQSREGCLGLGRQFGATGVVIGSLDLENNWIAFKIHLEGFGPPKKREDLFADSDERGRIAASEQIKALLFQKGPGYFRTPADIPNEPGVLRAGQDGAGVPTCVYCPDPQYSDVARAAKIQGALQLSIVVTEEGKAAAIYVLKGAPLGLTAQAIKAVQNWQFKPATKDGKPVVVRVPIEITFRLF